MNILQVNASYKPAYVYGGPTMSVAALSENLQQAGHSVQVYTTTANGAAELDVDPGKPVMVDGVQVTYFKRLTKDHSHFSPALLKQLWVTVKQFDVVHVHAWWNLVSMGACLVARLRGVPVVVSPRGTLSIYTFSYKNSFLKRLFHEVLGRWLLNGSSIHVTSPHEQKAIKLLLQPRRINDIPNFVTIPAESSNIVNQATNHLRLLFFSRIDAKKGIDVLIEALPLLDLPYRLTIAGSGDENYINQLKQLAIQKGVHQNIEWAGFCSGDEKFNVLASQHLLVLPSYDENFGNVVIESLSVGTPVLISEHVGLAEYVAKYNLGWICNVDPKAISAQIKNAWNDQPKLNDIRQRAPKKIRNDFAPKILIDQYTDFYKSAAR